jgi:probable HAF family extracellular repeat protein
MWRLQVLVASTFVAALGLGPASAHAQANYLVDLGVATGYGINNSGQAALDAGVYSNGVITPLPALPGGSTPAFALAINASGQIAGSAIPPAYNGPYPIAYSNGNLINILSAVLTGTSAQDSGQATGVNTSGEVVGWYLSNLIDGTTAAFTYANGTVTDLPAFPCAVFSGSCGAIPFGPRAFGINDSGQVVGSVSWNIALMCEFNTGAFIYSNGAWIDLGPGTAYAINASGEVTGTLTDSFTSTCQIPGSSSFLYANGATTNLGTLPGGKNSIGYAINATGQVVGSSDFTGSSSTHAFFYNGVVTDLNALIDRSDPLQPFITLSSAVGINDNRLILANGVDSRTNLAHAYLLQAPFIQVAPMALSFGTEAVGGTTQPQPVVVTNGGTTAISLGTISANSNFSLPTNNCGASLAPGAQCTIAVAFTPKVAGALTSGLTIPSAGANYVVALSGVAPITTTISASASTATVGTSATITWAGAAGSACTEQSSSATSPWSGSSALSGTKTLTDTVAETVYYSIYCTAAGTPASSATASVVWTWPAVTAVLSASPMTITAGQATTFTWTSSNATSCTGTGGASGDNWAGTKAISGSQSVTEPFVPANPSVNLAFGITCTSKASGLSGSASANVVDNRPPPTKSGGGGGFDPLSLIALLGVYGLRRRAATALYGAERGI